MTTRFVSLLTTKDLADTDASLEVPGMVFKVLLTAGGYNIEAAFPLAELQIAPSERSRAPLR